MPKITYVKKGFHTKSLQQIEIANAIIAEYQAQRFDLTLRQLYYQMVARGHIENSLRSYKNFGSLLDDARLAGMVDWNAIVDRTRNVRANSHWETPADIIESAHHSYRIDLWRRQPYRPEVWIEKDALTGVIGGICTTYDVPYFACRGYTSQSEMWAAAQRMLHHVRNGQTPIVLHLGDHDPSGIDMTRDIIDRLKLFVGDSIQLSRLALNWEQIEQFNPPPNPAKLTDSRADNYVALFGESSWELDALDPATISGLISGTLDKLIDRARWGEAEKRQMIDKAMLHRVKSNWGGVVEFLGGEL